MIGYTRLRYDTRVIREALAAVEDGFQVDFYALKEPSPNNPPGINVINTNFFQYKGNNKLYFILNYLRFFWFVLVKISYNQFKRKYRIIHVNNMPNFLVFACILPKMLGAKIILDIHDLVPEIYAEKFGLPLEHMLVKALYLEERFSGKFSDVIISTNKLHNQRFDENKINKKEYPIILNASDENVFTPFVDHDFNEDKVVVIFPSTIAQRLGIDLLLEAMTIIKKNRDDIVLRLFGDGEYKEELLKIISDNQLESHIEFHGLVDHHTLSEEYEKAHIGVVPWPSNYSTNYQMPIKVNEYCTKGLAIVASDIRILREYFSDCTLFYEAGNSQEFAEKIMYLADHRDVMQQLADKSHQFYKKNSWTRYKSDYQKILRDLVEQ